MKNKYTNILRCMLEEGDLDYEVVVEACLDYMTEEQIRDMMIEGDMFEEDELAVFPGFT